MSLPDAKEIHRQYTDFIEDVRTSLGSFLDDSLTDSDLKGIFKSAIAGRAIFERFAGGTDELLRAASGIARRCAVLAVTRQLSLARVELRRMIECVVWHVYFCDHPVERADFIARPGRSWADRPQAPIAAAASAVPATFFAYAKERLQSDPSAIGKKAVDLLHVQYGNLSAEVHAAMGAVHPSGSLALAFDRNDRSLIAKLNREIRTVFSACVLTCACCNNTFLARLDGPTRLWFDWLVSSANARMIRTGPFGIAR